MHIRLHDNGLKIVKIVLWALSWKLLKMGFKAKTIARKRNFLPYKVTGMHNTAFVVVFVWTGIVLSTLLSVIKLFKNVKEKLNCF